MAVLERIVNWVTRAEPPTGCTTAVCGTTVEGDHE